MIQVFFDPEKKTYTIVSDGDSLTLSEEDFNNIRKAKVSGIMQEIWKQKYQKKD